MSWEVWGSMGGREVTSTRQSKLKYTICNRLFNSFVLYATLCHFTQLCENACFACHNFVYFAWLQILEYRLY